MSLTLPASARRVRPLTVAVYAAMLVIAALAIRYFIVSAPQRSALTAGARAHAPDLSLLAGVHPAILVHIAAALIALPLGPVLLFGRKGVAWHRVGGRVWVAAMAVASVTPLIALTDPRYSLSFIHATIPVFAVLLPRGVLAAMRHDVDLHRRTMRSAYWMLIGSGVTQFIPGRLIWTMVFG